MAFDATEMQNARNVGFSPGEIALLESIASGSEVPPATTTTFGLVKKAVLVADPAALTTTQTADGTYDATEQAMLNAIKADLAVLRNAIIALIAALKAADKVMSST